MFCICTKNIVSCQNSNYRNFSRLQIQVLHRHIRKITSAPFKLSCFPSIMSSATVKLSYRSANCFNSTKNRFVSTQVKTPAHQTKRVLLKTRPIVSCVFWRAETKFKAKNTTLKTILVFVTNSVFLQLQLPNWTPRNADMKNSQVTQKRLKELLPTKTSNRVVWSFHKSSPVICLERYANDALLLEAREIHLSFFYSKFKGRFWLLRWPTQEF